MLEDHADSSAQLHQLVFVVGGDVDLIDQHPPAARLLQAVDGADQRRLACAAAPDDAENLAALDVQIDALQGRDRALLAFIDLAQLAEAHVGVRFLGVQARLFGGMRRRLFQWQGTLHSGVHGQFFQPT